MEECLWGSWHLRRLKKNESVPDFALWFLLFQEIFRGRRNENCNNASLTPVILTPVISNALMQT
jgi:hypothetical protein